MENIFLDKSHASDEPFLHRALLDLKYKLEFIPHICHLIQTYSFQLVNKQHYRCKPISGFTNSLTKQLSVVSAAGDWQVELNALDLQSLTVCAQMLGWSGRVAATDAGK